MGPGCVPVAAEEVSLVGGAQGVVLVFHGTGLPFCFYSPGSDSFIQPLEESNKFLELLRDIVRWGKGILDLVIEAPHDRSTFCKVIALNIGGIALEFRVIGGEVAVCLHNCLQFLFCCHHVIWVPECRSQNGNQFWDICQVNALTSAIGLDLH
jgi:hypothetical protein